LAGVGSSANVGEDGLDARAVEVDREAADAEHEP
jgi:hypothetical protein